MDLNYVLAIITCFSAIGILLQSRSGARPTWIAYSAIVLMLIVSGYFFIPAYFGYVAGAFWFVTLLLPALAHRRIDYYIARQKYGVARKVARLVGWIHPGEHSRALVRLMEAIELMRSGQTERASEILERDAMPETTMALVARSHLYAMSWEWDKMRLWIEAALAGDNPGRGKNFLQRNHFLIPSYIRALCETGRLNEALEVYAAYHDQLMTREATLLNIAWLILFAFSGKTSELEALLQTNLSSYTPSIQEFWRATAKVARRDDSAAEDLYALERSGDFAASDGARSRLRFGVSDAAATLTPQGAAVLEKAIADFRGNGVVAAPASSFERRPLVTQLLIAANVAVFAIETVMGGSEKVSVLVGMGALLPKFMLIYGQWWRCVSATFLHLGNAHLMMNMLGLYVLGPFLEFSLGRTRFLLCYMISGVSSMAAIVFLWRAGLTKAELVVGASGAIMGLIGASAWVLFRVWAGQRNRLSYRRLQEIVFNVLLQSVFDLVTPQVSFAAHASGLVIGVLLGMLLYTGSTSPSERLSRNLRA